MTTPYSLYDTSTLSNADVASIVDGFSINRLFGIFGGDHNVTVTVDRDPEPSSPADWCTAEHVLWAQLDSDYVIDRGHGTEVPAALVAAVDRFMPQQSCQYTERDHEYRVVATYASLHGYTATLATFSGTMPSEWTTFLFLTRTADTALRDATINEWRLYWDGEVYCAAVDVDGHSETLCGLYGDTEVVDYVTDTLTSLIEDASTEAAKMKAAS